MRIATRLTSIRIHLREAGHRVVAASDSAGEGHRERSTPAGLNRLSGPSNACVERFSQQPNALALCRLLFCVLQTSRCQTNANWRMRSGRPRRSKVPTSPFTTSAVHFAPRDMKCCISISYLISLFLLRSRCVCRPKSHGASAVKRTKNYST